MQKFQVLLIPTSPPGSARLGVQDLLTVQKLEERHGFSAEKGGNHSWREAVPSAKAAEGRPVTMACSHHHSVSRPFLILS